MGHTGGRAKSEEGCAALAHGIRQDGVESTGRRRVETDCGGCAVGENWAQAFGPGCGHLLWDWVKRVSGRRAQLTGRDHSGWQGALK